jgi:phosphoglycolate phosphatase
MSTSEWSAEPVRAVLLDLDGTLLDTAPDMGAALNALLLAEGRSPLAPATIRGYVSHGSSALVRLGFPHAADGQFEALRARFLALYSGCLARGTHPFPGACELLEQLEGRGVRWGVVTNKPDWLTQPLLAHLGLRARAGVIVSGDTLPERKPHPRPLIHAAQQLGVPPALCLYVGDAERDVLAARAAGMRVLVASYGYIAPGEEPRSWPAHGWIDSPLGVLDWLGEASGSAQFLAAAQAMQQ